VWIIISLILRLFYFITTDKTICLINNLYRHNLRSLLHVYCIGLCLFITILPHPINTCVSTYTKGSNLVQIFPSILQHAILAATDWESWPLAIATCKIWKSFMAFHYNSFCQKCNLPIKMTKICTVLMMSTSFLAQDQYNFVWTSKFFNFYLELYKNKFKNLIQTSKFKFSFQASAVLDWL
jgi:hypothetical protein